MKLYRDTLGTAPIRFVYIETTNDLYDYAVKFVNSHPTLAIDTESTGIDCYIPGWELRMVQVSNADTSLIIPARFKKFIKYMLRRDITWIGHNGPHDMRSIDHWLGEPTGASCACETYIPAHHYDSRKVMDGGIGHSLKEQALRYVASDADKWEIALKAVFKTIEIPIPGVYASGPRKGQQKVRKARIDEGWALIDPTHPAYIKYAGADPILTYRLWQHYRWNTEFNSELYAFDWAVQQLCDELIRRGIRVDVPYTRKLHDALEMEANTCIVKADDLGCKNINSGAQVATALTALDVELTATTPTGRLKTDDGILRKLLAIVKPKARRLIRSILVAKQLLKRRENYTAQFLRNLDRNGRIHASINTLAARTARMSVSNPPLQQLPTKDHESDL